MNWWEDQRTWSLNTFWRRWPFVMCKNCFPMCFFEGEDIKVLVVLKFERCEHRDVTYCRWRSRRCEMLIVFCVKRPSEEGVPLGGGIELYGSSSCLGGLRSLFNTEGILTLPMFLLSDGSLKWMWSSSFAWWCRVLLSLSMNCEIFLSSSFGYFVEMWWFLMALVVSFLWSETLSMRDLLVQYMYWAVQLWARLSSGKLCKFCEKLELDLLDAWVKTWWYWYL